MKLAIAINLGGALLTKAGRRRWLAWRRDRKWRSRGGNRTRAARAHERARHAHSALIKMLGGRCAECKATSALEVDHVDGREWRSNSLAFRDRVRRYWKEYKSGVRLRALCRSCNGGLGARLKRRYTRPAH